jgi:flavin reductase (DIM6/NTAB) family NADH-FMN oxidoreductase RutF
MSLKPINVKQADRLLYPVVPIIVTSEYKGRIGGMFAAWWSQLSFNPLLIGVGIAPERFTYKLLHHSKVFGLNFLDFKYVDKTPYIGDISERFLKDKLKKGGFTIMRGDKLNVPLISEASAAMELKLVNVLETGDHDWFVGEVVSAYASDAFTNNMWNLDSYKPLFYIGRRVLDRKVFRVYFTGEKYIWRDVEFAGGNLKKYYYSRRKVLNEIMGICESLSEATIEKVIQELHPVAVKYNLDEEDIMAYIEEAKRRKKIKII